jgi:hypothetical protein
MTGLTIGTRDKMVAAYADDTAIICKDKADFDVAMECLSKYERATGMRKNSKKTEVVTSDPEVKAAAEEQGFSTPNESKYLGCPVGINPNYSALWRRVTDKIKAASVLWDRRSASVWDRVMIAKAMLLSKVWYYGSVLPVPSSTIEEIEKCAQQFVWGHKPPKLSKRQMRESKKDGGLLLWDLESKIRALQAGWILKHLQGSLGGSLGSLIQSLCSDWAETRPTKHLLNDQDDNRAWINSAPIAECIYSWSKIVLYLPKIEANMLVAKINRRVERDGVTETLSGPFKVTSTNGELGLHSLKWDRLSNSWKEGKAYTARAHELVEIIQPAIGQPLRASPNAINSNTAIRALKNDNMAAGILPINDPNLKKSSHLRIREFGPKFHKVDHNKSLYETMVQAKEREGRFKKQPPVKINRFVESNLIEDYSSSVAGCWRSHASSKAKSTQWLLINHALPVASRIHREEDTPCPRCGTSPTNLAHVFRDCPRARDTWELVNASLELDLGSKSTVDFKQALNPGQDRKFSTRFLDTLCAVAIQHIWLDYCGIIHEKEGSDAPPEVLAMTILADFRLTMRAELKSLRDDLAWWTKKTSINPALLAREEVRENLENLQTRIVTLKKFLRFELAHDLGDISLGAGPPPDGDT